MKDFKFEDLTPHDISLINCMATEKINNGNDRRPVEYLIETVFQMLECKGYRIVKDETKEDTWSSPKKSWYGVYKRPKNWW